MKKTSRKAQAELTKIYGTIQALTKLLLNCKIVEDVAKKLKEKVASLDSSNPDYFEMLEDKRENFKMLFFLFLSLTAILVDYCLMHNALSLLIPNMPGIVKFLLVFLMVFVEAGISYVVIQKLRNEDFPSHILTVLPYAIIAILIAFSLVSINYAAQGYDPGLDGASFRRYITGPILYQIVLLVPSILLHVIIIKNSEEIHEYAAYCNYKLSRSWVIRKCNKNGTGVHNISWKALVLAAPRLVQRITIFKRNYPTIEENFQDAMPEDLKIAINAIMGRQVVSASKHADFITGIN